MVESVRECRDCGEEKPIEEFYKRTDDSTGGRWTQCKECANRENKKRSALRYEEAKEWLHEYKTSRGCAFCGYDENPEALDLHHPPQLEKEDYEMGTSHLQHWGRSDFKERTKELVVVCANCHRVKSSEEFSDAYAQIAEGEGGN